MDPNQERIDAHLDEWDNLTEMQQKHLLDAWALREKERAAWARFMAAQAERAAAINAEGEALLQEMGW